MKISAGTITRTVVLLLALVNQVLTAAGHSVIPVESETIAELISAGFTIAAAVAAWWKNNSFTQKAIEADAALKAAKAMTAAEK